MRHAAIGGGKRLRPLLTVAASRLFAIDRDSCAPGRLRDRGNPRLFADPRRSCRAWTMRTCGEASRPSTRRLVRRTAVLAGDSLHALAFEILADPATHEDPWVRSDLVLELARAAGPAGMAGGQMMDLAAEGAAARPSRDHAAAAAQDRRADRIFGRGRVHHGQAAG